MNHVLFPPTHNSSSHPELFTTPLAVSPSEHAQITALLPGFVDDFLKLGVDLTWMKEVVKKPMRAIFLHPDSPLPSSPPQFEEFTPLVLVTASKMMKGDGMEGEYIQGAGDDHEGWVGESGLSPSLFWRYAEELVGMPDDEKLLQLLYAVRKTDKTVSSVISKATLIRPTQNIYIASRADVESGNVAEQHGIVVNCGPEPLVLSKHSGAQSGKVKVLDLGLPTGKAAGKRIRTVLEPQLLSIKLKLEQSLTAVFVCDTGDGVAPAVTLAVLCLFYNEKGMTKEGLKGAKEKNDDAWS